METSVQASRVGDVGGVVHWPTLHRAVPNTKNYLAPKINSAKAEKKSLF